MVRATQADVEERAQIALQTSPIYALRGLRVAANGEALVVSGHVPTFYYKQMAQEVIRSVAKDVSVVNQVSVD